VQTPPRAGGEHPGVDLQVEVSVRVARAGGVVPHHRGLEPLDGVELMRARRGLERDEELCSGPGKLTQALGIGLDLNGVLLTDGPIEVLPRPAELEAPAVVRGTRIGINKAVDLPWRFCDASSRFVSRPWPPAMRGATRSRRA
jgi:DNA-3-methyladenine glycosylase